MTKINSSQINFSSTTNTLSAPKRKLIKSSSFVFGEKVLGIPQKLQMPSPLMWLRGQPSLPEVREIITDEIKVNEDFHFSIAGGFFIASEIEYFQNCQEKVSYLGEDSEVLSSVEFFDNFVTMKACKLLISDVLKTVISSLALAAIANIKKTLKRKQTKIKPTAEDGNRG